MNLLMITIKMICIHTQQWRWNGTILLRFVSIAGAIHCWPVPSFCKKYLKFCIAYILGVPDFVDKVHKAAKDLHDRHRGSGHCVNTPQNYETPSQPNLNLSWRVGYIEMNTKLMFISLSLTIKYVLSIAIY